MSSIVLLWSLRKLVSGGLVTTIRRISTAAPGVRHLGAILLIAVQAIAVFLLVWQPNFEYPLSPAVIKHDAGHSYIAEIGGLSPQGYEYAVGRE